MTDLLSSLSVLWIAPWRDDLAGILWCLWLGVVLAALYAYFRRRTLGAALTALKEAGAQTPETAKSAGELNLSGFAVRMLKSRDHLILRAGEGFYLPEAAEKKAAAVTRIGPAALWQVLLTALIAYAALAAAYYIIPLF